MIRSKALLVVYGEWESIENMLTDIDMLLPCHNIYVLGVVPCLRGRAVLNKLYVEVVMRKLKEEFRRIEEHLTLKNIGVTGKVIRKGRPGDVVKEYVEKQGFDIVFIPLQLPPSKRLLAALAGPVRSGETSIALYTPRARIGSMKNILILARDKPSYRFHTGYTSLVDIDTIELAFTHKPSTEEVEHYLARRKDLRYRHLVITRLQSRDIEKRIEEGLKQYRFVIIHPDIFYKKVFRGYMLTPLARAIILSTKRPLIVSA